MGEHIQEGSGSVEGGDDGDPAFDGSATDPETVRQGGGFALRRVDEEIKLMPETEVQDVGRLLGGGPNLEVWNPGRLPQGMTIDKLSGVHASRPVNPVLANPVYLTGYIEQMGTGTTDIIERCEKAGLRTPEFYQDEDFRTILWRPESADEQDSVRFSISSNSSDPTDGSQETPQKTLQKTLQKTQQKIIELVKEDAYITTQRMADLIGIDRSNIARAIKKLQHQGILRRVGPDKGGHWEIISTDR